MELTSTNKRLGASSGCRVFVPHRLLDVNESALGEYASTIIVVQKRWVFADETQMMEQSVKDNCIRMLDNYNFNPDTDYVMVGGDPLILAVFLWELSTRVEDQPIMLLRFDKKTNSYFSFQMR